MKVRRVHPIEWPEYVDRLADDLSRMAAGSGDRFEDTDIEADILAENMQAWIAEDDDRRKAAFLVTQIIEYPRLRVLRLVGLVGSRPACWLGLLADIENAARDWGCARLEAMAPPTWKLDRFGWTTFHILYERPL